MPVKLTKEEANRIMSTKGEVRIATFNSYYRFLLKQSGPEGVKAVEKKLKEIGYPIDLKKLSKESSLKWAPQAQGCLILVAILDYLNWEVEDAQKIGYFLSVNSFFLKLIIKSIFSFERTIKETKKLWRRHYNFSEMDLVKYDKKEKYIIFRINNFRKFHLALYYSIGGYVLKIVELSTGGKNMKLELKKCLFWGDSYDEFKISWD